MNFILYIKCTEEQDFTYLNPFYDTLKKEISNADFLDLDNFSGQDLISMALTAIKTAEKSVILVDILNQNSTSKFIELATYLADHPTKKKVFVNGSDEIISKILFPMENFSYHNLSEVEQLLLIKKFILA